MSRRLRGLLVAAVVGLTGVVAVLGAPRPAEARDTFGSEAGYVTAVGTSNSFASDGYQIEAHWRHYNKGRTAFEIEASYMELGLEGEIQNTIASFDARMRDKNALAQLQGGPGNGFMTAEFGTLEIYSGCANLLFYPLKGKRLSPFVSFGAGAYNWRVPFRVKFYRTPFFGEQHAWQPPAEGAFYAGTVAEEAVDFTKHETTGGLNAGLGATFRINSKWDIGFTSRAHLIFSSGTGNREEGIDDQDYLDDITIVSLKGGINYRF
jgi:hypothetical protein